MRWLGWSGSDPGGHVRQHAAVFANTFTPELMSINESSCPISQNHSSMVFFHLVASSGMLQFNDLTQVSISIS